MADEAFEYEYSAKKQKEIEEIKKKYLPKEEDKMETLRKLDQSVTTKGTMYSLVPGVAGALILGVGMSMCLVGSSAMFIPGIIIGILGMVILGMAYPLYMKATEKLRKKIAPQILALTEELMG